MEFEKNKLEWLESELLKNHENIHHRIYLRHGGVSKPPFDTLNVGDSVGDHPDAVKVNREMVREGMEAVEVIFPHQVHGTNIVEITSKNCKKTHEADALYTNEKKVAISIFHADCQAAVFYDPENEAIAVVHAGWKGLVKNIYAKTIKTLQDKYNTDPTKLIVCVSPSIGPKDAEFRNFRKEFPEEYWSYQEDGCRFDLWAMARMQLTKSGIKDTNIDIMEISTYSEPKDYYSARRDKVTGRHATAIMLV